MRFDKENRKHAKHKSPYDGKSNWQKIWYFIWEDDSIFSWIVNIILAFILIKFIVYPGLGFLLGGTSHPIVAVVSGSMEHDGEFDDWWMQHEKYYELYKISKNEFKTYRFNDGFNKGDIMVLYKTDPKDIKMGDVIVFQSYRPDPIIHRVIAVWETNGENHFQTKGDHNPISIKSQLLDETNIVEENYIGRAVIRVPFLGWVKIAAVELMAKLGIMKTIQY